MLTSHSRCHGAPPKEPWEYSAAFMDDFRRADEMKYRLMPYVYAQAKDASERGLPMVRALFIEYPDDPGSWQVDDEYLFGSDILVAPLMETGTTGTRRLPAARPVDRLPDRQGLTPAAGTKSQAGQIPVVMLVRDGAVIPHMKLAQSTAQMDWSNLEMVVFAANRRAPGAGLPALGQRPAPGGGRPARRRLRAGRGPAGRQGGHYGQALFALRGALKLAP